MRKNEKIIGIVLLFVTALIWGSGFVAQSVSMDYIGAFTFLAIRNYIAFLFLIPCIKVIGVIKAGKDDVNQSRQNDRKLLIKCGIMCGTALFVGSAFQQVGLNYTSVGKAGFITALYIVIVPIMGIFLKKKPGKNILISVSIAIVGLYLLCVNESFGISKGDFLELLCALGFSFHIMIIDKYSDRVDGVRLSMIQFLVTAIYSTVLMFIFEKPNISEIIAAAVPILYAGILSSGVAYTLQIIGQNKVEPFLASMIMSFESVFSVLSGWLILRQTMSLREILGCLFMFIAIIIAQLKVKEKQYIITE